MILRFCVEKSEQKPVGYFILDPKAVIYRLVLLPQLTFHHDLLLELARDASMRELLLRNGTQVENK
uniref:Uncharacterized protein n=1 Tax=Onchocerca volvulus TaxID=6282 RepID=A0A8R1Y1T0_ONCVO